jgi:microcystin-dependent protein
VRQGPVGGWSDGIPFRGERGSSVLSSDGPPSDSDGFDGDYNIDYTNWDIYGPKTLGAWGAPYSLTAPADAAQAAADTALSTAEAAALAAAAAQAAADAAQATADGVAFAASELAPPSTVAFVARNTAPAGWLKANGAAISRTTYADLFAAIGTSFGAGDGTTTFNVPDLRGEFLRAWDDGRGVDTGRVFGSFQGDLFEAHVHFISGFTGSTNFTPGAHYYNTNQFNTTGASTSNSVPAGGTETRPRNIALLAVIKF